MFAQLKTLVMMQLKDKIDLSFLKSRKRTLFKCILGILGFAIITAVVYLLFYFSILVHLFSVINIVPTSVVAIIITFMVGLSIITCTYGLMKTFYFSSDNPVLLTFPVPPTLTFVSKIIVYYLYEFIKNITFMFPVLVAFGMISNYAIYYYLWVAFMMVFVSAIPVAIGSLLSIPAMWISQVLKQFRFVQFVLIAAVITLVVYLIFKGISIIPANINLIARWGYIFNKVQDFLTDFTKLFLPFTLLTQLLVGFRNGLFMNLFSVDSIFIFLGVLAVICVFCGISFLLAKPLFLKMASKPFEYRKKLIKNEKLNKVSKSIFISEFKYEIKNNLRTPQVLYSSLIIFFILPIAIFFFNKILSAMNTRLLGQYLVYSFNILISLLIVLSNNYSIASVYSKGGITRLLNKTQPINPLNMLYSKMVWTILLSSISIIISMIIFESIAAIGTLNIVLLTLSLISINIGHVQWSAELDMMNPMYEQYATFGNNVNNPNEKKSTLTAFIISFLAFGVSLFLFNESFTSACLKVFIISLVFALCRTYLFVVKTKVYYKEIV